MLRMVGLSALALFLSACASTYSLSPQASGSQEVTYDRGMAVLMSRKEHGAVRVAPSATTFGEERPSLVVVAFNDSSGGANLGAENVQVFTASGGSVRVFTYEQLVKEAKNAAAWQAFAVALSGAANAYAASQPSTTYTNGSIYGRGGYTGFGATTTTYNPANAALANSINQARTDRSIAQIGATLDATITDLKDNMLRTTTIAPGEAFGGRVVFAKPKFEKDGARTLRVVVKFNGDEHEFTFAVGPS